MVAKMRLLAAESLNHSRALPLTWPLLAATRTDSLKLKVSPGLKLTDPDSARLIVCRIALLKPLLPPGTSLIWPKPTGCPFLNTSASRSNLVPTSSLVLSPTQTLAELVVPCCETVTVNEHSTSPPTEQNTVVAPVGKKEPDGGLQTGGSVPQFPVVVGFE